MTKLKAGTVAKSILYRVVNPAHIAKAATLHRNRKANRRNFDDLALSFYSEILPAGFLHYGYFDDVDRRPEDITVDDLTGAQERYAQLLIDEIRDHDAPVLDVGCGMGGLCRMMMERGIKPVALTPDRMQANHVRRLYPDVPVIHSKFEKINADEHRGRYGTIINSESFQYLRLDAALPLVDSSLKAGGRWIVCDYFKRHVSDDNTCHQWCVFNERIGREGWKVVSQRDITAHVLPTLRFIHMLARRFGLPFIEFSLLQLRRKQPAVHYMLEDATTLVQEFIDDNLKLIDPAEFVEQRQYMLVVIERA